MLSLTNVSIHFFFTPYSVVNFNLHAFSSNLFVGNRRTRGTRKQEKCAALNLAAALGFSDFKKGFCCGGLVRRCKKGWEGEGDLGLEAEVLEFMRISENPNSFPTRKQLVEAGRMDLVEGILKQCGWLSLGWDLDDGEEENQEGFQENDYVKDWELITARKCNALEGNAVPGSGFSSFDVNSLHSASSSGRSLEIANEDDSGIEGLLSRLEKERNINLGFGLRKKGNSTCSQSNDSEDDWLSGSSMDVTVAGVEKSSRPATLPPKKGIIDLGGKPSQSTSLEPQTWRTWINQRAGFSAENFEADEITLSETRVDGSMDASNDEFFAITENLKEPLDSRKETTPSREETNHNEKRNRIQNLELELSTVLRLLRPKTDEVPSQKDHANSSKDLLELSDSLEFQENEIMNARSRLRSIRAKLAVLEGKMALSTIGDQKMVEEKQNRASDASEEALHHLSTACIVWPNSASEVLVAGSFDGWRSQKKMEKSSAGVFSLLMPMYPGRYEIKFIVDGEWKIDPLRPIVRNNRHKNNLLIVT